MIENKDDLIEWLRDEGFTPQEILDLTRGKNELNI